ncbi:MAG: ATP-binding protein [Deltaproteobacteria bacterium]|nr:ATP-binding protein [Deltaproteobacteria bacterium]
MAEQHDVALSWAGGSALPPLTGHRDQLEQLMLNLYVNAIEAMPEGGTLTVTATEADHGLEIDVADTGSGIAPSDRKRIFEPFFSRKSGGSGLGLYLSRQVAEAHGGKIEVVESTATGTRIRIVLPCADDGIRIGATGAGGNLRE